MSNKYRKKIIKILFFSSFGIIELEGERKVEDMEQNRKELSALIEGILREIPRILEGIEHLDIHQKTSYRDLVTAADRKIEAYLRQSIKGRFPSHEILGEESYQKEKNYDEEHLWIIDPIDGTSNFVKQGEGFCTILSYFSHGEPVLGYVYDIKKDLLYSAIKGVGVFANGERLDPPVNKGLKESLASMDIRRTQNRNPELFAFLARSAFSIRVIGSSGLDGIRVVTGKVGAYLHVGGGAWDFSPFFLMADELGLCFTDFEGRRPPLTRHSSFILACPAAHAEIMEQLRGGLPG